MTRRRSVVSLAIVAGFVVPAAASADGPPGLTTFDQIKTASDLIRVKLLAPQPVATKGGAEVNGEFTDPRAEPTINGVKTDEKCIKGTPPNTNVGEGLICKPAAGTLVNLPNGKILYWDALEGTENNKFSIVTEGGKTFTNDSARLLDLGKDDNNFSWSDPKPFDGGANPNGNPGEPLIPGGQTTETYNDGALFGSHESFLPDGRLLIQGGTDYSLDPGVNGIPFGAVELTGLKATRIYDPKTNTFSQVADNNSRRWYPTLLEQGDGTYLEFSGVGKLLKPVYPDHPADSGTNVKQVEKYDPVANKWTLLPASADFDLPLYPRMHLLPDGHAFFNADGQDFNPFGQSVGEANWEQLAALDPKTNKWTSLGVPNTMTPTAPGFRGSTSSTLLALTPEADGSYKRANFLTAGGVIGTSPGSYVATDQSSITSVDTTGGKDKVSQKATGPLSQGRWFPQNVLLPTGEVVNFSGANADEVVGPGTEIPVQQSELFDPKTNKWTPIASQHNPRTYHNSAVLLPSGEVLVGGHATISTLYLNNTTLPGGFAPHDGRDPSFEIFKPPYLFQGNRPKIKLVQTPGLMGYGRTFDIPVDDPSKIDSVALSRNTAITHIVDADQRTIMLKVIGRGNGTVTVATPPDGNVAPPGPYMLFVNGTAANGSLVPSVAKQLFVTADAAAADKATTKRIKARCASRRAFRINVRKPLRRGLRSTVITVAGKRVAKLGKGKTGTRISLRGRGKGRTVVKLKMRFAGGRKLVDTRVYHPCVSRKV